MTSFSFRFRSNRPATPRGKLAFFLVWTAIVICIAVAIVNDWLQKPVRKDFVPVTATVTDSTIRRDGATFWIASHVTFEWADPIAHSPNVERSNKAVVQAVTRDRTFDAGTPTGKYVDLARLRDTKYMPGMPITLYVDPQSPSDVLLSLANPKMALWLALLLLSPFVLVAVVGLRSAIGDLRRGALSKTHQPSARMQTVVLWIFCLVFLFVGLMIAWKGDVETIATWQSAKNWPAVPCTIVDSWIESGGKGSSAVRVLYQYERNGKTYRSDRWSLINPSDNVTDKTAKRNSVRPGSTRSCFVDPSDPYSALLDRDFGWAGLFLLFPIPFIAVGAIGTGALILRQFRGDTGSKNVKSVKARPKRSAP